MVPRQVSQEALAWVLTDAETVARYRGEGPCGTRMGLRVLLLGHASWSTTMDLYTHRVERLQRDASERIEAALFAASPRAGLAGHAVQ
ncbi:MAG: hypothetical protein ACR2JO_14370 [Mycobacteriales bacterium]